MECAGTVADHCCWIPPGVCPFVDVSGDRPVCTLRAELGSWQAVHVDSRYLRVVAPTMRRVGVDCGDWPAPGVKCAACGGCD